mmetsp:Transcript_31832/g.64013  ORF Transcript_31832/g.64013 Transcript_31832/m.64013 type:complete len:242 (+) Transcript_31832:68-793(+)|eukprot:CAMPEP_0196739818 /NCGR_PEP_ID=MMETSP1091-20130531/26265_1 /TAXON_ID=302021 /ORGANISM="Rhodomonas sp., Strain CCMP768" /LENGTH=241 /DNA_ID=CAMNT_0042084595 /DNA_START=66 /DNA_END=791 /DNA_ORIENTATION=-
MTSLQAFLLSAVVFCCHFHGSPCSSVCAASIPAPQPPTPVHGENDFFPEVTEIWKELPIRKKDDGIPAIEFLDALDSFLPMFDRLGAIFYIVKSDMGGNVAKLRKKLASDPSASIQDLIRKEIRAGHDGDKHSAADALLWLTRALDFIHTLLDKMVGGLDANRAAREAYEGSLMQHHGFIVKRSFQVGLMTAPSTASMLKCLGTDPGKTATDVKSFVNASRRHLQVLKTFVVHEKLDKLTA